MTASWAVAVAFIASMAGVAVGDMISEEIRTRLDRLPFALIRLAGMRLHPGIKDDLTSEWSGELHAILRRRGAATLPVTRLLIGIRYALGLHRAIGAINSIATGDRGSLVRDLLAAISLQELVFSLRFMFLATRNLLLTSLLITAGTAAISHHIDGQIILLAAATLAVIAAGFWLARAPGSQGLLAAAAASAAVETAAAQVLDGVPCYWSASRRASHA